MEDGQEKEDDNVASILDGLGEQWKQQHGNQESRSTSSPNPYPPSSSLADSFSNKAFTSSSSLANFEKVPNLNDQEELKFGASRKAHFKTFFLVC